MWNERHVQIPNAVKTSQVGLGLPDGCAKAFKEKVGGAKTNRAELAKLLRRIEPGDVLIVSRLDRLARSTRDLLNVIAALAERGAGFKSLKDAWADTTSPHGRLMLTVLGGLAEFERELIRARTDGILMPQPPRSAPSIPRHRFGLAEEPVARPRVAPVEPSIRRPTKP